MAQLLLFFIIIFQGCLLHATLTVPEDLIEFSKRKASFEKSYDPFKKDVLEMISRLQTLEVLAQNAEREAIYDLSSTKAGFIKMIADDLITLLSQPQVHSDQEVLEQIKKFYLFPSQSGEDPSQKEEQKFEKIATIIARSSLPLTKLFHAYAGSSSRMVARLGELHAIHLHSSKKLGYYLISPSDDYNSFNLLTLASELLHKTCLLFWWGERLKVSQFKDLIPHNTELWKHNLNDWNGPIQKALNPPVASEGMMQEQGVSTQLRVQMIRTATSVFKQQLSSFYARGWELHDIGSQFPELTPLISAYMSAKGLGHIDWPHTPYLSLIGRIQNYYRTRNQSSKGIFEYEDASYMLETLDLFLDNAQPLEKKELEDEAAKILATLDDKTAWDTYKIAQKQSDKTPSSNLFVQSIEEERKNRFNIFDPASVSVTHKEGLQRLFALKEILNDPHIKKHLANSPLSKAISYYNLSEKIFDMLFDSWMQSFRTKVDKLDLAKIKVLFKKNYTAIRENEALLMDHLFLFYLAHPIPTGTDEPIHTDT